MPNCSPVYHNIAYILNEAPFSIGISNKLNDRFPIKLAPLNITNSSYNNNIKLPSLSTILNTMNTTQSTNVKPIQVHNDFKLIYSHRKRRKSYEIHRKFKCIYPQCNKSYGALNHLNFHIKTQNHGCLRRAKEFKLD